MPKCMYGADGGVYAIAKAPVIPAQQRLVAGFAKKRLRSFFDAVGVYATYNAMPQRWHISNLLRTDLRVYRSNLEVSINKSYERSTRMRHFDKRNYRRAQQYTRWWKRHPHERGSRPQREVTAFFRKVFKRIWKSHPAPFAKTRRGYQRRMERQFSREVSYENLG